MDTHALPNLSKATTEALFVGVASNIDRLENDTEVIARQKFINLRNDPLFSIESLKEGLAQKDKVKNRLIRAVEIFA